LFHGFILFCFFSYGWETIQVQKNVKKVSKYSNRREE